MKACVVGSRWLIGFLQCYLTVLASLVDDFTARSWVSHALVNQLGEKWWVNHELTPLCVVGSSRLSRDRLFERSARFLQFRDLVADGHQHVAKLLQLRLVADRRAVSRNDNGFFPCRGQVGVGCGNHPVDAAAC